MKASVRRVVSLVLVALLLPFSAREARASGFFSTGEVVGVVVGIAAVGAAVVIGVYYGVRKPRTDGCVVSTPDGLTLMSMKQSHRVYKLSGSDALLKPGERVKVIGRRKGDEGMQTILVSGVTKDYGPCPAH